MSGSRQGWVWGIVLAVGVGILAIGFGVLTKDTSDASRVTSVPDVVPVPVPTAPTRGIGGRRPPLQPDPAPRVTHDPWFPIPC